MRCACLVCFTQGVVWRRVMGRTPGSSNLPSVRRVGSVSRAHKMLSSGFVQRLFSVRKFTYSPFVAPKTPTSSIFFFRKEEEVLEALKKGSQEKESHFTTYSRPEIPHRFHFKNCDRTPPILLTAELGYLFDGDIFNFELGQHGYDPKHIQMKSFFLAIGPLFKKNVQMDPFENIHIYPLTAYILGLPPPAVPPNGTLSVLQGILTNPVPVKKSNTRKPEETLIFRA
ncbi:hypothetical protein J6590_069574 [Homalodisca vitripennis]|nr:hypothetical protein J6590_069574 [Homalodisca vitripennis]